MKGPKALMKNNPTEEIKEARAEAIKPALAKLRGRFSNFVFTNRKIQTCIPISNEYIVE